MGGGTAAPATTLLPIAISLLLLLLHLSLHASAGRFYPLVIIPGTGASQIYARLTDAYLPSSAAVCGAKRPSGWFRLWENERLLKEPLVQCFSEQMAIHYDAAIDDYRNTPGVETLAPHFGSVEGFRHRDPDNVEDTPDMAMLLERLVAFGYREGEDLFGAPYDYRYGLAAAGHPSRVGTQFLDDLRALVERAASANGGKPVVLLAHSMGGLLALQLLNRNPPPWRRRFVKHLLAVAVPWGGAVPDMEVYASGHDAIPGLDTSVMTPEMATYESNLWLLPSPGVFGGRPLAVTPRRNYSAVDLPLFLSDVGFPEAVPRYKSRILPLVDRLDPPGVPVTCVSGMGVPTPEVLVFGDGFGRVSEVVFGDGDGVVNMESLLAAPAAWSDLVEQRLKVVKVANATHTSILRDEVTWGEIMDQVSPNVISNVLSLAAA